MNNVIIRYFTEHLKNTLNRSHLLAKRRNNPTGEVALMDLIIALAEEKGGLGSILINSLTVIQETRKNLKLPKNWESSKDSQKAELLPFSVEVRKILLEAIKISHEFQFPYVGTEHLLFAIINYSNQEVFLFLGKNKEEIKRMADQLKKVMLKDEIFLESSFFTSEENASVKQNLANTEQGETLGAPTESLQDILAEAGDFFSSLFKNKMAPNSDQTINFGPNRPPFGVINPTPAKEMQMLSYFARNLNEEIKEKKIDPVIGRDEEIDQAIRVLMRKTKNNPVLVGEPGVGKTAIVTGLAHRIMEEKVPRTLLGKKIMSLDMGLLVAGTSFRGEFEDRLKRIIEEAESDPTVILFIDELHNIVGAGSAQGSLDAANIVKPALARGQLRCIGATTTDEYQKYIEKDGALERRFQSIFVKEPSVKETIEILEGIRSFYAEYHRVKISREIIKKIVELANLYLPERNFPDKAIDLLDETATFLIQKEEKIGNKGKDLPVMKNQDVAEVLAKKLNIPSELFLEDTQKRLSKLAFTLRKSIKGQNKAVEKISASLKRKLSGIADPERPAISFLFVGPTGVGKTYLAKLLAQEIFLRPDALIRVDMSEFNEKHTVSRLLGSPPGYVGYGENNDFTNRVRKNPYSLILFDEIEKAHPEVFHILLQVLEDGFLTDGSGRKINFRNTILIFTSNLGNDNLFQRSIGFSTGKDSAKTNHDQKNEISRRLSEFLKPEFLSRITSTVFFEMIDRQGLIEIARLEFEKLKKRSQEIKKIRLEITPEILSFLAKKSFSHKEGARTVRRNLQIYLEEPLAEAILKGSLKMGDSVKFLIRKRLGKEFLKMKITTCPSPKIISSKKE